MAQAYYDILGQVAPTNTSETILYTVPGGYQAIVSTISACALITTGSVKVRLHICKNAVASSNANAFWRDVELYPGQTETLTLGIGLNATAALRVTSNTANGVAFSAFGTEIH